MLLLDMTSEGVDYVNKTWWIIGIGLVVALALGLGYWLLWPDREAPAAGKPKKAEYEFSTEEVEEVKEKFSRHEFGTAPDKEWVLEFDEELDETALPNNAVAVTHMETQKKIEIEVKAAGNQLILSPPKGGYEEGGHYSLSVEKGLPLVNGKKTPSPVTIAFGITRKDEDLVKPNPGLIQLPAGTLQRQDDKTLTLKKTDATKKLQVDDIIILEGKTRYDGVAYKVMESDVNLNSVSLTVTEPAFDELFEEIDVYKTIPIEASDLTLQADGMEIAGLSLPGREIASSSSPKKTPDYTISAKSMKKQQKKEDSDAFAIALDDLEVEDEEKRSSITLNGDLTFYQTDIHLDHQYSASGGVKRLYFDLEQRAKQELTTTLSYKVEGEKDKTIMERKKKIFHKQVPLTKKPILLPVGGPMAIEGELSLFVEWGISGEVEVTLTFEQTGKIGLEKKADSYASHVQFDHSENISLKGRAKAGIQAGVQVDAALTAYKVIGVGLKTRLGPYMEGGANYTSDAKTYTMTKPKDFAVKQTLEKKPSPYELNCSKLETGLRARNYLVANFLSFEVFSKELPTLEYPAAGVNSCLKFQAIQSSAPALKLKPGSSKSFKATADYRDYLEEKEKSLTFSQFLHGEANPIGGKKPSKKFFNSKSFTITSLNEDIATYDPEKEIVTVASKPTDRYTYLEVTYKTDDQTYKDYVLIEIDINQKALEANRTPSISGKEGFDTLVSLFSKLSPLSLNDVYGRSMTDPNAASTATLRDQTFKELTNYTTDKFFNEYMEPNYRSADGFCFQCDTFFFPAGSLTDALSFEVLENEPGYMKMNILQFDLQNELTPNALLTVAIKYEEGRWKVDEIFGWSSEYTLKRDELLAYFGDDVVSTESPDFTTVRVDFGANTIMYYDLIHATGEVRSSEYGAPDEETASSDLEGVWEAPTGSLTISSPTDEVFNFSFFVSNGNSVGELGGIAEYTSENMASYSIETDYGSCKLDFELGPDTVSVKETPECLYYHGPGVNFEGVFERY